MTDILVGKKSIRTPETVKHSISMFFCFCFCFEVILNMFPAFVFGLWVVGLMSRKAC